MTAAARPLVLVAASGLAREVAEVVRLLPDLELVGVLDDDPARAGTRVLGHPVLGPSDLAREHPEWSLVVCAGSGAARAAIAQRLGLDDDRYAAVVHPSVDVPPSCSVGAGSVLLAGTVLTADVTVGRHVVVMPGAVLTHDVVLADHATVCASVSLAGGVHVGPRAYVGQAATVRQGVAIGAAAVVGTGAVVLTDVPEGQTWVGNPARRLHPAAPASRITSPAAHTSTAPRTAAATAAGRTSAPTAEEDR